MRYITQRTWNWFPQKQDDLFAYIEAIDPRLHECVLVYKPYKLKVSVRTTEKSFCAKLQRHFTSGQFAFERGVPEKVSAQVTLVYLADTSALDHSPLNIPGKRLMSSYERTDVAFDPLEHVALLHGPKKFGFVKSLVLGLVSYHLAAKGLHGLHSALVKDDSGALGFCGRHGAGKSSFALIYALTGACREILSDDWILCRDGQQGLRATPLERAAYLEPTAVKRILDAVPASEIMNYRLHAHLTSFLETTSKLERGSGLGIDGRMDLQFREIEDASREEPVRALIGLLCDNKGEGIHQYAPDAFVDLLLDSSYHIPFHSAQSRQTLGELARRKNLDEGTRALVAVAVARGLEERSFWRQVSERRARLVLNTQCEDLWKQYEVLRRAEKGLNAGP